MSKATFVLTDDATFMRRLFRQIIEEDGNYTVVGEADDGYAAINKAKEFKPDIMTLDLTMPNLDGLQALKEITKVSPHTKVIIVSAMGQQPMVIDAIKAGAKDFIVKPFDKTRVHQAIINVLHMDSK